MLAVAALPAWQAHPEVWLLVAGVVAARLYAGRVIGPKAAVSGAAFTRRQTGFFVAGIFVLWAASDWPLHDIAEERLYSLHMVQHLLLTFLFPPLMLLATPEWLARLVLGRGRAYRVVRRLTRPVVAGVLFNALVAASHVAWVVNTSVTVGPLHYVAHTLLVVAALCMWAPVCGPLPEARVSLPAQMVYLFLMSVLPTIPAAFLTFAENALYSAYDHDLRLWGVTVAQDQQAAGLIMKLAGGAYLWTIITYLFFSWAARHERAERAGVTVSERDVLTWDHVEREFARLEELDRAPHERPTPS
ncbi:MAG: cytochrome c oxidase assembly protein [Acidimicrobiales bacterium]